MVYKEQPCSSSSVTYNMVEFPDDQQGLYFLPTNHLPQVSLQEALQRVHISFYSLACQSTFLFVLFYSITSSLSLSPESLCLSLISSPTFLPFRVSLPPVFTLSDLSLQSGRHLLEMIFPELSLQLRNLRQEKCQK